MDSQKIYSTNEVAELLNCTKRTISSYCKIWEVPKSKGVYQITDEHIEGFRRRLYDEWVDMAQGSDVFTQQLIRTTKPQENSPSNILEKELSQLKTEILNIKESKESEETEESYQEKLKKAIELITIESAKKGLNHRVFTEEEYNDMIGTISIVESQEEQIQYLRERIEKQDAMLQNLARQIEQRNYIEAKKQEREEE